jgi:hypothetical protein
MDMRQNSGDPAGLSISEPLRMAIDAFRERFSSMLADRGFAETDIKGASLTFRFTGGASDYDAAVRATIVATDGKRYSKDLGFLA